MAKVRLDALFEKLLGVGKIESKEQFDVLIKRLEGEKVPDSENGSGPFSIYIYF